MAWQRDITGEHREKVISQFILLAEAKGKKAIFHDPQISSGVGFVYCLVIGSTPSVAHRTATTTP